MAILEYLLLGETSDKARCIYNYKQLYIYIYIHSYPKVEYVVFIQTLLTKMCLFFKVPSSICSRVII